MICKPLKFVTFCNKVVSWHRCILVQCELGCTTKHLMTGPTGSSKFCFPLTSMLHSASPRGTLSFSGYQNSLFPLGRVIKCLLFMHRIKNLNGNCPAVPDISYLYLLGNFTMCISCRWLLLRSY